MPAAHDAFGPAPAAHDDPAGEIRRGQYPDLTYLVIRVNDDESSDLTAAFADSHRFINECRAASGRCLVHCKAGKSRSVSLVVHHLVADGATLADAWEATSAARPEARPIPAFRAQLCKSKIKLHVCKPFFFRFCLLCIIYTMLQLSIRLHLWC